MNETQFKVIGTWGAQKYTTVLGTFDTLQEAMNRVDNWQDAPEVKGMHIDLIEVVKHTQSTVWFAKDQSGQDNHLSESSNTSPSAAADPDYERVGIPPSTGRFAGIRSGDKTDYFQPFDDLQETVRNLEDRHVGMRHDTQAELDVVFEAIGTLRDDVLAYKEITEELDAAMRHEVAGLRREMENLRSEIAGLRGDTNGFPHGRGA